MERVTVHIRAFCPPLHADGTSDVNVGGRDVTGASPPKLFNVTIVEESASKELREGGC